MTNAGSIRYLVSSNALLARRAARELISAVKEKNDGQVEREITALYQAMKAVEYADGAAYEYLVRGVTDIMHGVAFPPPVNVPKVKKRKLTPRRQ